MNKPEDDPAPVKRHWIPVLPVPRPDTLQNAKRAQARSNRARKNAKKLDDVLGTVDDD